MTIDYLLFQLYGPLAAWGDIAVGEYRPSYIHPTKSAILGLLAAALGIRRDQDEEHQKLAKGYGYAVRVDVVGHLLRDFHTTQKPHLTRKNVYHTRRDELQAPKLDTILSTRDYRCDALYTVCLWQHDSAPFSLLQLKQALQFPKLTLYLGRKSCPLALPVQAQICPANTLKEAFTQAKFYDCELKALPRTQLISFYWDETESAGMLPLKTVPRYDIPLSRTRWQFAARDEYYVAEGG